LSKCSSRGWLARVGMTALIRRRRHHRRMGGYLAAYWDATSRSHRRPDHGQRRGHQRGRISPCSQSSEVLSYRDIKMFWFDRGSVVHGTIPESLETAKSESARRYSASPAFSAGHRASSFAAPHARPGIARPPKHRHSAPQASGYPNSAAPPTIAVAALLGLARWCRQHGQQQGASPCADTSPNQSPPASEAARPEPERTAPLGPTHPWPAARTRSPRRASARPASTDGRPSGGQP
jgi:hypothetical protein